MLLKFLLGVTAVTLAHAEPLSQHLETTLDIVNVDDFASETGAFKSDEKQDEIYKNYKKYIETKWKRFDELSFSNAKRFGTTTLSKEIGDVKTVFYPFSGPDIIYPLILFPHATTFIFSAREAIGEMSLFNKPADLKFFTKAFESIFQRGFFITKEMCSQLYPKGYGVAHLIVGLLGRLGLSVESVHLVTLDKDLGGVQIKFTDGGISKTIYYFRANLKDPEILKKLMKDVDVTFIKSSSYTLHNKEFHEATEAILENTPVILQDDTGVPLKDFKANKWDVKIFGDYEKPYGKEFQCFYQKDLARLFQKTDHVPLDFRLGYGFGVIKANLILAKRQQIKEDGKLLNAIPKTAEASEVVSSS
jgi:hypothetical protein